MKKIAVFFFLAAGISGFAQEKPLTLADAINTALKSSYDIQLAKNNVEISNINNNRGVAGGLPTVTGSLNDNQQLTSINQEFANAASNTKRDNVGSNTFGANVTASMLLYNGSRVMATQRRLEQLKLQNEQVLVGQIQNTIAAVMTKYYDVVRQQSYLKTIFQSIDVSKKRLEILQIRKEVGMSNNADIIQAQLDINALVQTQQSQELVILQAKTDLLNLIFLKPDTKISISDTIIVDKNVNLDTVRTNLAKNPLLAAADLQVHINEQIEKETAALRYPSLRATTGYSAASASNAGGFSLLNQSWGPFLGVNLSIPIYAGSASKRQQQIASINTKNAMIQRENILLDNETGLMRTYQAYTNTMEQLHTEEENYKLSIQLLDLVLQRFQLGQATIIDVKVAQQSFENEGYRLVNLNYSTKVAEIELKRLGSQLVF
jgi:outer membrane protein